MTTQTVCDRCNKVPGRYASISWDRYYGWSYAPEYKDLCKDCFKFLFPEWSKEDSAVEKAVDEL